MPKSILIVEDDELQRDMLAMLMIRKLKLESFTAENGRQALDILKTPNGQNIRLVIMDVNMPVMGGLETLEIMRQQYPDIPVIMLTGSKDINDAVTAMKKGAQDFITKPYEGERMITTVQNVMKMSTLSKEVSRLKTQSEGHFKFENLIGFDKGLLQAVTLGRKAASSDISVLINGETGTGKEVFAHAIHGSGNRAGEAFIAVNCGAIPSQLVESTLFGHEKGAFTGATEKTIGKFREAQGGTIFLDEVAELPLDTQVKLLRVLQQREVEPVGAGKPIPVNVRVISATNKSLEEEVKKGTFREDLFFRLNVLQLELPPLKNRKQDIPDFARHFIERHAVSGENIPKTISDETLEYLKNAHWPGNVRQLENTIKRALVLSDKEELSPDDFNKSATPAAPHTNENNHKQEVALSLISENGRAKTLNDIEKDAIEFTLKFMNGNVTKTAESLGLAKSTLYKKLKTYNINI